MHPVLCLGLFVAACPTPWVVRFAFSGSSVHTFCPPAWVLRSGYQCSALLEVALYPLWTCVDPRDWESTDSLELQLVRYFI